MNREKNGFNRSCLLRSMWRRLGSNLCAFKGNAAAVSAARTSFLGATTCAVAFVFRGLFIRGWPQATDAPDPENFLALFGVLLGFLQQLAAANDIRDKLNRKAFAVEYRSEYAKDLRQDWKSIQWGAAVIGFTLLAIMPIVFNTTIEVVLHGLVVSFLLGLHRYNWKTDEPSIHR